VNPKELRPGLWTWTGRHPDWTPDQGGPDGWDEMVRSYALVTRERAVLIDPIAPLPDLLRGGDVFVVLTCAWHRRSADSLGGRVVVPADEPDAALPDGVSAQAGVYPGEAVLWLPAYRALVAGDSILDRGGTLAAVPDSWLPEGSTRESVRAALGPLLELPVELVLPTHGDPVTSGAREALAAAVG
jgi:hypothetical protein